MKTKNLDKQHHGGIDSILGNRYEADFFVRKLVEMLVHYRIDNVTTVRRQKARSNIDDIYYEEANHTEHYCQCRKYAIYDDNLYRDSLYQFDQRKNCQLELVTQRKDKVLDSLMQDAKKYEFSQFDKRLKEDTQLRPQKSKFEKICSLVPITGETEETDKKHYVYAFLNHFSIELFNDFEPDKEAKGILVFYGYSAEEADRIYDRFVNRSSEYTWLDANITIDVLQKELEGINVEYIAKKDSPPVTDLPMLREPKAREDFGEHILQNAEVRFTEKLSYMLDLATGLKKPRPKERAQALRIIEKDEILSWHFLKNLNDTEWFSEIKNGIVKTVATSRTDSTVKRQLLNYLTICADKYSDEVIPLLAELGKDTEDPFILAALIKTTAELKPSKKGKLATIWQLLREFAEHKHPWVRSEIPNTLRALAEYDLGKSLEILRKLFLYTPKPSDVTQGSPTLALTFRGKDNEDWVFGEAVKALSQLISDERFSRKAFGLAMELEVNFIKQSIEDLEQQSGIVLDYSYIWLANRNALGNIEHEYDKRKRLALEIEKQLDEIAASNKELAKDLLTRLLEAKCEVFYLTAIKVLTRHIGDYMDVAENLIFTKELWVIHEVRDYFLQNLTQEYFKQEQKRLSEYVQAVKALTCEEAKEADYAKQALFISIPEEYRSQDVNKELERLEAKLESKASIQKAFEISVRWGRPEPDVKVSELKGKTDDELIEIMEDSTVGHRKSRSYDVSSVFGELVRDEPDRLPDLLKQMKGKEIDQRFSGEMITAYIASQETGLQDILSIFWLLQKTDRWARVEVARYLNQECRKKEIADVSRDVFGEIKSIVFALAADEDPEDDGTIESNMPRPEDAVTRGINSVRGIAAEILVALAYYFPEDRDIDTKLKTLSKDKTKAVRATVIYNLRYLRDKKYDLCQQIARQFQDERDVEIDFAIITYFASLDPKKFGANKDFLELLFGHSDDKLQQHLGELVGYRYIDDGFEVEDLVDAIAKHQKGNAETRRHLAFVFESALGKQIAARKHTSIIPYFKQLLDPAIEPDSEVRKRAAFVFERDELKSEYFDILDNEGIFNIVLKDTSNIVVQNHLLNYLHKCVKDNKAISRCIEIIHSQVMNINAVLEDPLIVKGIAEIVKEVFAGNALEDNTEVLAEQIFNKGLEKGWDDFYSVFHQRFARYHTQNVSS